jgi:predicted aspartyl protease
MDRFSVEFEVANNDDIVNAKAGGIALAKVRRMRVSGVVDTGAARLVLPARVANALGLQETGKVVVRFADGRKGRRSLVGGVFVRILDRSSVFTAVVERGRTDALIGAIVLEELDLIPDCTHQALVPRDPRGIFAEIE